MKIDITKLSKGRLDYMKKRAAKLGLTLDKYVAMENATKHAVKKAVKLANYLAETQSELDKQGDGRTVKPLFSDDNTPVIKFYDANNHVKLGGMMTTFPEGYTKAPDLFVVNVMVYKPRVMTPCWQAMSNQGLVYMANVRNGTARGNEQMVEIQVGTEWSQDTWLIQASVVSKSDITREQKNALSLSVIRSIPTKYQKHFYFKAQNVNSGKAPTQLGYVGLEMAA